MEWLGEPSEKLAGGMAFGVADDGDANAETRSGIAFGNCFGGVVGTLGVDAGAQVFEKAFHVWLIENYDVIHGGESGDEFGASLLGQDGSAGALEIANAGVGIYRDNEDVSFALGAFEIAGVANVKNVKAAVSKDDAAAAALFVLKARAKRFVAENFCACVDQSFAFVPPVASLRKTSRSSARETVAVPRFMTTIPPA